MLQRLLYLFVVGMASAVNAFEMSAATKLTGTVIGTERCWNYSSNKLVMNQAYKLFDGNLNNYFATEARSYTWAGLDLGEPHVITKVGWAPRNDSYGPPRVVLGMFQGANSPDFLDAVPLYVNTKTGTIGRMDYAEVHCTKGFRYVRYVGPSDARCNLAELEFYGEPGEGSDSEMYQLTNLPTVIINTVDAQEPYDKEHDIVSNIMIINNGKISTQQSGTVRLRGNSSFYFPKKPMRIKFDKKQQPLDAPAKAKKWTLISNYGDKSLMRNMLAFEIGRRLGMPYVPYSRGVDVILNGEYKGCYQLCDQVEINPNRLNITEMSPEDIEGDALTGGYFVEVDAYAEDEPCWFRTSRYTTVTIKSPDSDEITPEQKIYIRKYYQKMESAVFDIWADQTNDKYLSLLDRDSFLRHFMVNEFVGNTDTYWSVFFTKERGDDRMKVGTIWDFDLGFDNDNRTYPVNNVKGFLYADGRSSAVDGMREFARRIVSEDPTTHQRMAEIWTNARELSELTADDLCRYVDDLGAELNQSQKLNFTRWPILGSYVHQNPRVPTNYAAELSFIKSFIRQRFTKYDAKSYFDYDTTLLGNDLLEATDMALPEVVAADGCISLSTADHFVVTNLSGAVVFSGTSITPVLTHGIYIVSIPSCALTRKVVI